jgi:hypothetical protein
MDCIECDKFTTDSYSTCHYCRNTEHYENMVENSITATQTDANQKLADSWRQKRDTRLDF